MLGKPLRFKHLMLALLPATVPFFSANASYGFTITTVSYVESELYVCSLDLVKICKVCS